MGVLFFILGVIILIFVGIFFYFLRVWVRAAMSGASVTLWNLLGMKLRGIAPTLIVDARIRSVKAGLGISTDMLEAHYLAGGDVINVVNALIAADKAAIELTFQVAVPDSFRRRADQIIQSILRRGCLMTRSIAKGIPVSYHLQFQ